MLIRSWMMTAPQKPLECRELTLTPLGPGEAVVQVAGCGVCHTDLSFLRHGVKTRHDLPLALGHEISGTVIAVGDNVEAGLVGHAVLVPAVLPCGSCDLCQAGHRRICRKQTMPGNDVHGGFATHVKVPARYLCRVPAAVAATHELWELAIVADAMSTPFQAVKRANVNAGDVVIIVGTGGIGLHGVQIAAALKAIVVALDIDDAKLDLASRHGAKHVVNVKNLSFKEIRKRVTNGVSALGGSEYLWKVFEMSGTKAGQDTAFSLLTHGSTLAVVGFTMDKLELRLSNLMAFDATAFGNWGCDAALYPEIMDWIGAGKIQVRPFVERFPLQSVNQVLELAETGRLQRRAVLVP